MTADDDGLFAGSATVAIAAGPPTIDRHAGRAYKDAAIYYLQRRHRRDPYKDIADG